MNLKVTLDTNCFFSYFRVGRAPNDPNAKYMDALVQWGLDGKIDLAMTTRVRADTVEQTGKSGIWKRICDLPVVETIGAPFRFSDANKDSGSRFPEVGFAGDVLVDANDDTENRLKKIMAGADQNDIDHLWGHTIGKRDIFVTSDPHFLDHVDALRELGPVVMDPASAVVKIGTMLKTNVHNQTDPE
jgi:hypothetical protein